MFVVPTNSSDKANIMTLTCLNQNKEVTDRNEMLIKTYSSGC